MQIKSLNIQRAESWQPRAGELVGACTLEDGLNVLTVQLSDKAITDILEGIRREVRAQAVHNTRTVSAAFVDAIHGPLKLEEHVGGTDSYKGTVIGGAKFPDLPF